MAMHRMVRAASSFHRTFSTSLPRRFDLNKVTITGKIAYIRPEVNEESNGMKLTRSSSVLESVQHFPFSSTPEKTFTQYNLIQSFATQDKGMLELKLGEYYILNGTLRLNDKGWFRITATSAKKLDAVEAQKGHNMLDIVISGTINGEPKVHSAGSGDKGYLVVTYKLSSTNLRHDIQIQRHVAKSFKGDIRLPQDGQRVVVEGLLRQMVLKQVEQHTNAEETTEHDKRPRSFYIQESKCLSL